MLFSDRLAALAVVFLCANSVIASKSASNASQHATANAAGDAAVDHGTVLKYKTLLDDFAGSSIFAGPYTWADIVEGYMPLNADCSTRCATCAPGCNPACCTSGVSSNAASGGESGNDKESPYSAGRSLPIEPLACPCHCEADCPSSIQAVCCSAAGLGSNSASDEAENASVDGVDAQKTFLEDFASASTSTFSFNPHKRIWGRPNRPLACPCFCDPTCPPYIQAVCCTTPGSGASGSSPQQDRRHKGIDSAGNEYKYDVVQAPKTRDTLTLVTQTGGGGSSPVSVLAAVGTEVFDSFISLNLVQGLRRTRDISYNAALRAFEITLPVVFEGQGSEEVTLAQTFAVIDGSGLMEREQILIGLGFMGRVETVDFKKVEGRKEGVEGLPLLAGARV